MDPQSNITDKIRRLLKLGESSNQHEAAAALAKAAELARRYSIDLGSIQHEAERARVIEKVFETDQAYAAVHHAALNIALALFHVRVLHIDDGKEYSFTGLPHNIEAASFARAFAVEQCTRDLLAYRRERQATNPRRRWGKGLAYQFCLSWAQGVQCRYQNEIIQAEADTPQLADASAAIVLRDQKKEVDDYLDKKYGKIPTLPKKRIQSDVDSLNAGFAAGYEVNLRAPLSDKTESQPLLC